MVSAFSSRVERPKQTVYDSPYMCNRKPARTAGNVSSVRTLPSVVL